MRTVTYVYAMLRLHDLYSIYFLSVVGFAEASKLFLLAKYNDTVVESANGNCFLSNKETVNKL